VDMNRRRGTRGRLAATSVVDGLGFCWSLAALPAGPTNRAAHQSELFFDQASKRPTQATTWRRTGLHLQRQRDPRSERLRDSSSWTRPCGRPLRQGPRLEYRRHSGTHRDGDVCDSANQTQPFGYLDGSGGTYGSSRGFFS